MRKEKQFKSLELRSPRIEDGGAVWQLVKETRSLDLNSPYSYLILCKFFNKTCVVAEHNGQIVGFISGFNPPEKPDVLFIWQVAVAESQRKKGLGLRMLKTLLKRPECKEVQFLELTVNPSNHPAISLYAKLARDMETSYTISECFSKDMFPAGNHEPELLYRIGPFFPAV
ncbi:MAG: diaminobutyrate acetyltransferase [Syntrophomonadaceae bacterium]|jgi:L-2,4-diaminobutyric acid acetyltransferase|nr:diaminobutyrate acetyltransferase [Syntrophomonadaceae bacterium]